MIVWQENTIGDTILCYRDNAIYYGRLQFLRLHADKMALSDTGFDTRADEYGRSGPKDLRTLHWRDVPGYPGLFQRLPDNESVARDLPNANPFPGGLPFEIWRAGQ